LLSIIGVYGGQFFAEQLAMTVTSLDQSYDEYPRIEAAFQAALDESLHPRGPDLLYEIVDQLGLPPGAAVIDLGCSLGPHTIELAKRSGFAVIGVDPVWHNLDHAAAALREAATHTPELCRLTYYLLGTAEYLPLVDASIDLI
jgi:SAM-dependent methyltransferase